MIEERDPRVAKAGSKVERGVAKSDSEEVTMNGLTCNMY